MFVFILLTHLLWLEVSQTLSIAFLCSVRTVLGVFSNSSIISIWGNMMIAAVWLLRSDLIELSSIFVVKLKFIHSFVLLSSLIFISSSYSTPQMNLTLIFTILVDNVSIHLLLSSALNWVFQSTGSLKLFFPSPKLFSLRVIYFYDRNFPIRTSMW